MSDDFKARKIRVYRNGDTHYVGKRMVVNGRVFKNFEQVKQRFTRKILIGGMHSENEIKSPWIVSFGRVG